MEYEIIGYKGLTIKIAPEQDAVENPYNEQDMLTEVVTWMRSYEFSSNGAYYDKARRAKDYDNPAEIKAALAEGELVYAAPLFAYVHSGITVNLGSMGNWPDQQWDCGLAGFVYIEREKAKAEFPKLFDKNGRIKSKAKLTEACHKRALCEVETLDQWLTGDVWCYGIEDSDGQILDSCGWVYGYQNCLQMATEQADYHAGEIEKARAKAEIEQDSFDEGVRKWGDWRLDLTADGIA